MATHNGRAFLNSCLKVPIDPCNNCPAPVYNRPRMYLGRLGTATPMSTTVTATGKLTRTTTATGSLQTDDFEPNAICANTGRIRSLAKLYDSIPDYSDMNHLSSEEFYSTLDTLRSACCELRTTTEATARPTTTTTCNGNIYDLDDSNNTTSTLSTPSTVVGGVGRTGKKSPATKSTKCSKNTSNQRKSNDVHKFESRCITETPCSLEYKMDVMQKIKLKKNVCDVEVEAFKESLKELEEELKRPRQRSISQCQTRSRPMSSSVHKTNEKPLSLKEELTKSGRVNNKGLSSNLRSTRFREYLRKSYSFNDLHSPNGAKQNDIDKLPASKCFEKLSETEAGLFKDPTKMSNYFLPKTKNTSESTIDVPIVVVQSPSSENLSSNSSGRKKKTKRAKNYDRKFKPPFTIFDLGNNSRKESTEPSNHNTTPTPVHAGARQNLAATLRVEVSKKKLRELKNNCTFHDTTPLMDWEVRRTPAWKSLTLNESHKQILAMRLAARKAEQAQLKRVNELNMELMRQRVKSAPLLLEGATYWGPNVGKLTHTCQFEGIQHACQSNQQRNKKKSKSRCTSVGTYSGESVECFSRSSSKLNILQSVYGTNGKSSHQNSTYRSTKTAIKKENKRGTSKKKRQNMPRVQGDEQSGVNDSGDELSSLDRAYL